MRRFSLYKKKKVRIMAGAQPRPSCRSLFKQLELKPIPCQYTVSLMNSLSIIRKFFKQIRLYTILIQGINFIFIDKMPACFVLKKSTFYASIKTLNSLKHVVTILKNYKAKFKAALRKYQHTHSFYSVYECFMCKDDLKYCFVNCL